MTQSLNDESRKHIEQVAGEALAQLESIAETAKSKLHDGRTLGSDALASINTMTSSSAIQRLDQISQANRESYQVLVAEPAIARVVVADEEGEEKTYYICRTTPVSGFPNLASYRAPVGRLASLAIGAEFTLPNGTVVEVLERAQLRPNALADGWDSRDTVVEAEHFGPFTIESLRALLTEVAGEEVTEDILGQLLAEETVKANIIDGVRRSVITKMGLRDQPILDQYQDEIFRLPLDKRLLILGPPGTGKTTTLIRRLGQKLDTAFLEEGEQRLVETVASAQGMAHANSWLADRIREIERFVGQLPSTAIFVNTEDNVAPVADALNAALAEHNIQVIACREGQAVGQESNVRVFDIQHIKGLEFEAVFFVGIDQLATLHPALFDKYLYVGTTRAATYLGVTCQGTLPSAIESLRTHFCQNWQQGD